MASISALNILRNLRALVGQVTFDAAVTALNAEPVSVVDAPGVVAVAAAAAAPVPVKEKKPRKVNPEATAKRSADMAALQRFIQHVRKELGDATPYKEAQKVGGERWKALKEEERASWYQPAGEDVKVEAVGEAETMPVAEIPKAVWAEPAVADKKPRGRPPKKVAVAETTA